MARDGDLTASFNEVVDEPEAHLSAPERQFLEAIRTGLAGDSGRMQQLLRRSLSRSMPAWNSQPSELQQALLLAATQAIPPIPGSSSVHPRDLASAWRGPTRVPESRFRSPTTRDAALHYLGRAHDPADMASPHGQVADKELPAALTLDTASATKPFLTSEVSEVVEGVVAEHASEHLAARGIPPTRTVLLTGPPGTGKTMTARWVAQRLKRPLLMLDLAAVMSHELGRSASNLAAALDVAQESNSVLFIDEFDAVASARVDANDVGEMRRVVNVLLVRLDRWPAGHLLLAATNHPELLDRAVNRRFEVTVELPLPDFATRLEILSFVLSHLNSAEQEAIAAATEGLSGSDMTTIALQAARRAALRDADPSLLDVLMAMNTRDQRPPRDTRDLLIRALNSHKLSSRQIGELVGVSHVTVREVLKREEAGAMVRPPSHSPGSSTRTQVGEGSRVPVEQKRRTGTKGKKPISTPLLDLGHAADGAQHPAE